MYRKVWTIPDRVFDILDGQPLEVEVEVVRAIRAYHRYFDDYGSDEGFDVGALSAKAQSVFWRVYDELHEADERYAEKCAVLRENACIGVEAKKKKQARKEAKKKWYHDNKEKVSRQRKNSREKNGNTIPLEDDKKTKENVSNNFDALSNTVSNNGNQSQADSQLQKMSANAYRQLGLNNIPTLHSGILLEVGCGEKPSYPQGITATEVLNNNRTGNLSCNKAGQPPRSDGVCDGSKGSEGSSRQFRQFGIRKLWQCGNDSTKAVSAPDVVHPAESARKLCEAQVSKERQYAFFQATKPLPSAPHKPKQDEVRITKDFKIDFDDPTFAPYFRADKFLRRALQDWLIKNKIGASVEKKWIVRQLVNFAKRQGKLKLLMGVADDE